MAVATAIGRAAIVTALEAAVAAGTATSRAVAGMATPALVPLFAVEPVPGPLSQVAGAEVEAVGLPSWEGAGVCEAACGPASAAAESAAAPPQPGLVPDRRIGLLRSALSAARSRLVQSSPPARSPARQANRVSGKSDSAQCARRRLAAQFRIAKPVLAAVAV